MVAAKLTSCSFGIPPGKGLSLSTLRSLFPSSSQNLYNLKKNKVRCGVGGCRTLTFLSMQSYGGIVTLGMVFNRTK